VRFLVEQIIDTFFNFPKFRCSMCMTAFRARMLLEVNNFRNNMIESGVSDWSYRILVRSVNLLNLQIENTTEILAEVRASYDACMAA
jgi:hypothetical protein